MTTDWLDETSAADHPRESAVANASVLIAFQRSVEALRLTLVVGRNRSRVDPELQPGQNLCLQSTSGHTVAILNARQSCTGLNADLQAVAHQNESAAIEYPIAVGSDGTTRAFFEVSWGTNQETCKVDEKREFHFVQQIGLSSGLIDDLAPLLAADECVQLTRWCQPTKRGTDFGTFPAISLVQTRALNLEHALSIANNISRAQLTDTHELAIEPSRLVTVPAFNAGYAIEVWVGHYDFSSKLSQLATLQWAAAKGLHRWVDGSSYLRTQVEAAN